MRKSNTRLLNTFAASVQIYHTWKST